MIAFYAGAEIPTYRELLHERGVRNVSFNWLNHQRRVKDSNWLMADYFADDVRIFVDSGAATYRRPGVEVDYDEILDLAGRYFAFVEKNLERIHGYVDFDAGTAARAELDPNHLSDKGLYVWHAGQDAPEFLSELGPHVAIAEERTPDPERFSFYRQNARDMRLHLVGADRSLLEAQIKWESCHFSAWYSAQQRGELFVWAGHQLRRYMPDRREDALRRHRPLIETLGLDLNKVASGDGPENLRLAIWSWSQYFGSLENTPITPPVTRSLDHVSRAIAAEGSQTVTGTSDEAEHDRVTDSEPESRERTLWPGIETTEATVFVRDPADGVLRPQTETRLAVGANILNCTGCYLAKGCPSYKPGSKCAYSFTTRITTKDQRLAAAHYVLETQLGRMAFAVAGEQRDGGYADKATSAEIDRTGRLLKLIDEMETTAFTLTVKAQQRGGDTPGLLTRLFGSDNAPAQIEPAGIVDAEIVSEEAAAGETDRVT